MLYSQSILQDFLKADADPQDIADALTLKVCEVEEIRHREIPDDVVIGYVTSTKDHPDADKLTVCQVDCGARGVFQICCGASNVRAGIFVVAALPGCHLPAIDLTIEPRELRGEASNGMICSKQELGIDEDKEQKRIRSLQVTSDAATTAKGSIETTRDMTGLTMKDLGMSMKEKFSWLDSWVMDVENKTITHKPEMFGHFGLAVELDSFLDEVTTTPVYGTMKSSGQHAGYTNYDTAHGIPVTVKSDLVSTYATILLKDIGVGASSFQDRLVLTDLGQNAKSDRVDFSNLFMQKTGQPVHFFDADKLAGGLIIRQAEADERFEDLFGKEHTLTTADIVIADEEKICALAGIIGSNTSGIDENTSTILVEIANFDPVQVRKTGTRLGLRTDAEIRFEKTINPLWTAKCVEFFLAELETKGLKNTNAGITRRVHQDMSNDLSSLTISRESVEATFGKVIQDEGVAILQGLGFQIDGNTITIPARRSPDDIETEACIVEEIVRIQGFDQIESVKYSSASSFVPFTDEVQARRVLEGLFIERAGYDQVETYPWIHKNWRDLFSISTQGHLEMENSLNPEWSHLRPTMLGSMLEVVQKNNAFFPAIKVFDIGSVRHTDLPNQEESRLAFVVAGVSSTELQSGFLEAKAMIDSTLQVLGAKGKLQLKETQEPYFHPRQQASIHLNGKEIGIIATMHPLLLDQCKLPEKLPVTFVQLNLHMLIAIAASQKKGTISMQSYETLQDQIIRRDMNFVVDKDQEFGSVHQAVAKVKEIKDIHVFDIYAGEHLPDGKKSIAIKVKIVSTEELKISDINAIIEKATENVKQIGGELR